MAESQIHSFHINVGNGDGAIHLLVKKGDPDNNVKHSVQRALLIDGGKPAAVDRIKRAIAYINDVYEVTKQDATTAQTLRFDGIVVTKWAVDHSAGILKLLIDDIKHTSHPKEPCTLLKYDGTTPKSTFYSPFWAGQGASQLKPGLSKKPPPTTNIKLNPADKEPSFALGTQNRLVDFIQATKTWEKICFLVATPNELIGRELFTGAITPASGTDARNYGSVADLVKATEGIAEGTLKDHTGIYCIAADGHVLSNQTAVAAQGDLQTGQRGTSGISLLAIVKGSPQHYFSGDSDYQLDKLAAQWINTSVPVTKLNSHGSIVSTPSEFLDTLKPSHLIASAGPSLKSMHPRWELLVLLKAFINSVTTDGKIPAPFFHPTNYPVYFVDTSAKASAVSLDFEGFGKNPAAGSDSEALQDAIKKYDPVLFATVVDALAGAGSDVAKQTEWAVSYLRNLWSSMSYSTPEQHAVVGSKSAGAPVSPETQLLFVRAILSEAVPVISYINGANKTVATSGDAKVDPNTLTSFQGKNFAVPTGAQRKEVWTEKTAKIDAAPGGVTLPSGVTVKSISSTTWLDKDDETPSDDYVSLLKTADPPGAGSTSTPPPSSIFSNVQADVYFLSPPAYTGTMGPNIRNLNVSPATDNLDTFVAGFEAGFFGFKGAATDSTLSLDSATNIWAYLMSAKAINTAITLNLDPKNNVKSLTMVSSLFGAEKKLTFDTQFNAQQFNSNTKQYWDPNKTGCTIPDTGVVVVGLDIASTLKDLKLADVLTAFQMKAPAGSNFEKFLREVKDPVPLLLKAKSDPATEDGLRNALWCFSGDPYHFTLRLNFLVDKDKVTGIIDQVVKGMKTVLGLDASAASSVIGNALSDISLEAEMTGTYHLTKAFNYVIAMESSLTFEIDITIDGTTLPLMIEVGSSGDLQVSLSNKGDTATLKAAAQLTGNDTINQAKAAIPTILQDLQLKNVWMARKEGKTSFGVSLLTSFHKTSVGFTYSSAGVYGGALILGGVVDPSQKMLPEYDVDRDATALGEPHSQQLDLLDLFFKVDTPPRGIPTKITQAAFEYTKAAGGTEGTLNIYAELESTKNTSTDTSYVPAFDMQSLSLQASKSPSDQSVSLSTTIQLNPAQGVDLAPATMTANADRKKGNWVLKAHLDNFQLGLLFSHFPRGYQNAVTDFIGKIDVSSMDATYTFDKSKGGGGATSFLISGVIALGDLELRLAYQYVSPNLAATDDSAAEIAAADDPTLPTKKGELQEVKRPQGKDPSWQFDAILGAAKGQKTKISAILDSIDPSLRKYLPTFVLDTEIAPASADRPPVSISLDPITLTSNGNAEDQLMFRAWIEIGDINLTFIQLTNKKNDATSTDHAPPVTHGPNSLPKRIVRFALTKLPFVDGIPIIKELPQPFDDLEYVWVQYPPDVGDPTATTDPTGEVAQRGFTKAEIDQINIKLADLPHLQYKQAGSAKVTTANPGGNNDAAENTVVLAAGQHFIVVQDGSAVLDYVFGSHNVPTQPTDPPKGKGKIVVHRKDAPGTGKIVLHRKEAAGTGSSDTQDAPPVKKGALGKTIAPLTVDNVGLKFENGVLWVMMDATVKLGPISFSLIEFGIGVDVTTIGTLTWNDKILTQLAHDIRLQLHGMAMGFEQPPLTLAGVFMHDVKDGVDAYAGGLALGFPPYTFVAVGEYAEVTNLVDKKTYKSVFVYAKLDGPLITLEFATIEGIRIGFGYNSIVRSPTIDELSTFPFIDDGSVAGAGNNPLAILRNMQTWISVKDTSYWGAVGLKVTAFDILAVTAVALLQFSDLGCDIAIFGNAIAQMPAAVSPNETIVYIELDFVIELGITEGFFRAEAALAPTSHIYVPQCKLTGGFALCYWFGKNPAAGDFVFSAGGYHKAFTAPSYYPQPKRLGINFTAGNNVSVTGEAYFAICPKAVMGGGRLHLQVDVGPVSAYADAWLDMLIMFKPFHYTGLSPFALAVDINSTGINNTLADFGISVGVTFDADVWIVHIHVSGHVDAELTIAGPPFGGVAHVDFYLFGFDIYFGNQNRAPPKIPLAEFLAIVQKPGPDTAPNSDDQSTSEPKLSNLKLTLEGGNFPAPTTPAQTAAPVDPKAPPPKVPSTKPGDPWRVRAGDFQFRVSCDFAINSYTVNNVEVLDSKLVPKSGITSDIYANPCHISSPIDSHLDVTIKPTSFDPNEKPLHDFRPALIVKAVPKALWAAYDESRDPSTAQGRNSRVLLDGTNATENLAMGVTIKAPKPVLSADKIPAFHAQDAMNEDVFTGDKDPDLDPTPAKQTSWVPAPVPHDDDQVKMWQAAADDWRNADGLKPTTPGGPSMLQEVITACTTALGWDKPPPEVKVGPALPYPPNLTADAPSMLLDGFDKYYLVLPMIAGVGA